MKKIIDRDLRNHGSRVIDQVLAGEYLTVTRDGHAVAVLKPLPQKALEATALLERWRTLPPADGNSLKRDLGSLID